MSETQNKPTQDAFDAHQLMKLHRANDNLQSAKNDHQSVIKSVEAKGVNLKAAAAALKIKKSGKSEEVVDYVLKLAAYLKILGYGFTEQQIDLFAHVNTRAPDEDKAYERGLYVGRMGEGDGSNPYALGSAQSNKFLDGVRVGTEERRAVLDMEMRDDADERIEGAGGDDDTDSEDDGDDDEGSASDLTGESPDDPFDAKGPDFIAPDSETANEIPA